MEVSGGDLPILNGIFGLDLGGSQNIADLAGNPLPFGEPLVDETYEVDNAAPLPAISSSETSPTKAASIPVAIDFGEEVTGFVPGDVIIAVNGDSVKDPESFAEAIHSYDPGDEVTLTVYRSGETEAVEVDVVLSEHPDVEGQAYLGVTIGSFLRIEGNRPFHQFEAPFHFEFQWPDGDLPEYQEDPGPGDEA